MARTTVKLGEELARRLDAAVRAEGYTERRKSVWISEAIIRFSAARGQKLWSVGAGDDLDGFGGRLTVTLSDDAEEALSKTVAAIRRTTPLEEGVRSAVVRTALRDRIALVAKSHPEVFRTLLGAPKRMRGARQAALDLESDS